MKFVVAGYGWCGRGLAIAGRGAGAKSIVTEIDPTKALEAVMDGFRVMSMEEAAKLGDVFCTVTGNKNVLAKEHFEADERRRDYLQLGPLQRRNRHSGAGQDVESSKRTTRTFVEEYTLSDGRSIYLLGEGRLINLPLREGHPRIGDGHEFRRPGALRRYMVKNHASLEKSVYTVPDDLDKKVAKLKLESMGIKIDMTDAQSRKSTWQAGRKEHKPSYQWHVGQPYISGLCRAPSGNSEDRKLGAFLPTS